MLNNTIVGSLMGTGRGGTIVTPEIVPFKIYVFAVLTNKVETARWSLRANCLLPKCVHVAKHLINTLTRVQNSLHMLNTV